MSAEGQVGASAAVMEYLVSLTYRERLTPELDRFVDLLLEGRFSGHRCPACARVYVPPKGYCPLCVVATGPADEVELPDTGTVTGFTIVTPVAYYGQRATEPFVHASVLLDGADTPLGGMDVTGVSHPRLRAGLRVRARWRAPEARSAEGISNRGWGSVGSVVESFEATGEPDAPQEGYAEHLL